MTLMMAVTDSNGASIEYIEAITELGAMQQVFMQASHMGSHRMLLRATVHAATNIVMSFIEIIAKFQEPMKKYLLRLSDPGTSGFQNPRCKMGSKLVESTLYKSHELQCIRETLHTKLTLVHILLSAAS